MSTLYLIRHGQASSGSREYDKLSELGSLQSRVLAEHILKRNSRLSAIYTGAMVRHRETLAPLISMYDEMGIAAPPVATMEEFNEYDWRRVISEIFPEMIKENPSLKDEMAGDTNAFQRILEAAVLRWVTGNYTSTELPRWEDFCNRVQCGIDIIMKKHCREEYVAVFTSRGAIAATMLMALHLSNEDTAALSWKIVNASITSFTFTGDGIALATFNEHSFLTLHPGENPVTCR
jgi:broad specificity phosphatase PhoE